MTCAIHGCGRWAVVAPVALVRVGADVVPTTLTLDEGGVCVEHVLDAVRAMMQVAQDGAGERLVLVSVTCDALGQPGAVA